MSCLGRLRLITFDVTNTLLQFRTSRTKQYGELGALFGVLCDTDALARNFKSNWLKMNTAYPNFGRNTEMKWQTWWVKLVANTFADSGAKIPEEKLDQFTDHLVEMYKTSLCWQHCNGTLDLLNYLRKQQDVANSSPPAADVPKPFVMGVIANFDPRLDTLLRNMKINQFFKFAINSYDCKVEKPNREIFEIAMRASELPDLQPTECLHIGDGPVTDYLAAKALGWNAALIHDRNANYLIAKYGDEIDEHFVFPSFYDFQKKLTQHQIHWK